jgi:hypothetical protein
LSQIYKSTASSPPPPGTVTDLQGNDGVTVPPNGAGIIFTLGNGVASSGISTAGNLYTTGNAGTNTETINQTQAQFMTNYTNVAASPYVALATDYYISVNTGSAITIQLPNAPTTNRLFIIKDRTGNATVNHISVTTVGGAVTIDGQTTYTLAGNFGSIQLLFNGTSYEVY